MLNKIDFAYLISWLATKIRDGSSLDRHDISNLESMLTPTTVSTVHNKETEFQVVALLRAMGDERKIEAIKAFRTLTGYGLKESKDAVEYGMRQVPRVY